MSNFITVNFLKSLLIDIQLFCNAAPYNSPINVLHYMGGLNDLYATKTIFS